MSRTRRLFGWSIALLLTGTLQPAAAADLVVANDGQLTAALTSAVNGDRILLAPGTYSGGRFVYDKIGITVRSQDPANPATIQGGTNGILFSRARNVVVESLRFANQTGNALAFDDGGDYASQVTTNILVREVILEGAASRGIFFAGVYGFLIDRVTLLGGWGSAAIDVIGGHDGTIQNSRVVLTGTGTGMGIRVRGGSTNVVIRANRVDSGTGTRRGIQAGGATAPEFFRPPLALGDGQPDFDATDIEIEGNVVTGGDGSVVFVGTDRVVVRNNYFLRPAIRAVRILNENIGGEWGPTRNGELRDNVVVFTSLPSQVVNVGASTDPATFVFAGNRWYNEANPASSTPVLPVVETAGVYGVNPNVNPDDVLVQTFAWGQWLLNLTTAAEAYPVADPSAYRLAVPGSGAELDLSAANPFVGSWSFVPLDDSAVALAPFTQAYLVPAPPSAAVPVPPVVLGGLGAVLLALGRRAVARASRAGRPSR